ncbi:MAG: hypothetical protein ACK5V3_06085 [Bdellovibrionales bacterium]
MRPSDQEAMFELSRLSPMKLPGLDLIYDRSPDFQNLLNCQSSQFETYVSYLAGELLGHASISWKTRLVNGEKKGVAYLGDLRMRKRRESARVWREFYQVILSDEYRKKNNIDYYLTAVLADNKVAIKNLTQSRNNKFSYHLLGKQMMVNILGINPFSIFKDNNHEVSEWVGEINSYNWDQFEEKEFSYLWKEDEDQYRKKNWNQYTSREWMKVNDQNEKIILITHPWAPTICKRMTLDNLDWKMAVFLKAARLFGLPSLNEGSYLDTLYLTGLHFSKMTSRKQKASALAQLIREELKRSARPHMISFADSENLHREPQIRKNFLLNKTEVLLFQVTRTDEAPVKFKDSLPIEFEMALV